VRGFQGTRTQRSCERTPRNVHPKIRWDSDSKKRALTPSQAERTDRHQVYPGRLRKGCNPRFRKTKATGDSESEMDEASREEERGEWKVFESRVSRCRIELWPRLQPACADYLRSWSDYNSGHNPRLWLSGSLRLLPVIYWVGKFRHKSSNNIFVSSWTNTKAIGIPCYRWANLCIITMYTLRHNILPSSLTLAETREWGSNLTNVPPNLKRSMNLSIGWNQHWTRQGQP
jgi:hypothetical protein